MASPRSFLPMSGSGGGLDIPSSVRFGVGNARLRCQLNLALLLERSPQCKQQHLPQQRAFNPQRKRTHTVATEQTRAAVSAATASPFSQLLFHFSSLLQIKQNSGPKSRPPLPPFRLRVAGPPIPPPETTLRGKGAGCFLERH